MRDLRRKICGMSDKSLAIQIETLLNAVQELYAELEADASAQRDIYAARMKDPQQFAADTGWRMEELTRFEKESLARFREIELQFNLDNENQKLGKELKKNCEKAIIEIDQRRFDSSDTVKTADNFLTKINQDFEDDLKELAVTIAAELREEMSNMQVSLQPGFRIRVPKIPLTDLLQKLREESTSTIEVQEPKADFFSRILRFLSGGRLGTRVKKEKKFDANEYFAIAKSTLRNKFLDRKSSFAQGVKDKMNLIRIEYLKSVSNKIEQRKNEIEKLRDEQIKNQEVRKRFDEASANVEAAKGEIAECKRIRGNL